MGGETEGEGECGDVGTHSHQKRWGRGNPAAAVPLPGYFQLGFQPSSQTAPSKGVSLPIPSPAQSLPSRAVPASLCLQATFDPTEQKGCAPEHHPR